MNTFFYMSEDVPISFTFDSWLIVPLKPLQFEHSMVTFEETVTIFVIWILLFKYGFIRMKSYFKACHKLASTNQERFWDKEWTSEVN